MLVWNSEEIPGDWRTGIILQLYKDKGSKMECSNFRSITRLSVPGKVFAHITGPHQASHPYEATPEAKLIHSRESEGDRRWTVPSPLAFWPKQEGNIINHSMRPRLTYRLHLSQLIEVYCGSK